MWLKRKAVLKEDEQGCAICLYYDRRKDDVHLRCDIIEETVKQHGWMPFSKWIQAPDVVNECSQYINDPQKTKRYEEELIYQEFVRGKGPAITPEPEPQIELPLQAEPKPAELTKKESKRLWLKIAFEQDYSPEIDEPYKTIVEQAGGQYLGIRSGGEGYPLNVWFNHPKWHSTMLLPVTEITVEKVKSELDATDQQFSGKI
jgi:hypothetical protein